jgi:hypothetical protein
MGQGKEVKGNCTNLSRPELDATSECECSYIAGYAPLAQGTAQNDVAPPQTRARPKPHEKLIVKSVISTQTAPGEMALQASLLVQPQAPGGGVNSPTTMEMHTEPCPSCRGKQLQVEPAPQVGFTPRQRSDPAAQTGALPDSQTPFTQLPLQHSLASAQGRYMGWQEH